MLIVLFVCEIHILVVVVVVIMLCFPVFMVVSAA